MDINTVADWWQVCNNNWDKIRNLITGFHPATGKKHNYPITAAAAEKLCQEIRDKITELPDYEVAFLIKDHQTLLRIFNQTWFGLPESEEVRRIPGFHALCDLCSEGWVFNEGEENDVD